LTVNNAWSSCPVRALISPGLCSDILLGLLFLSHNHIVVDHHAHTAIDQTCGVDLLNDSSNILPAKPVKLSPKNKRKYITECCKLMLAELEWKFALQCNKLEEDGAFETIRPFDIASASLHPFRSWHLRRN